MSAHKSAIERKQERKSKTVGRDKASNETVELLNSLRTQVDDPNAAAAIAMLHAQINGDHPDYERPPDEEPFGIWNADLAAEVADVADTTSSGATVDVELTEYDLFDTDAELYLRFIEDRDNIDRQVVETDPITLSEPGADTISIDSLNPDTTYGVQVVAEASVDTKTVTEFSDRVSFTTDPA